MTTEPSVERTRPPLAADERTTLLAFLAYHRDTVRLKAAGLTAEQLAVSLPPSSMTLGGMVKHLAFVEHWWLHHVFLGRDFAEPWASVDWDADGDWDWHSAAADTPEELWRLYDSAIAASDAAVAGAPGLDELSVRPNHWRDDGHFSLRWILVHLIEEYARHNGHADLIRESIDGATGE